MNPADVGKWILEAGRVIVALVRPRKPRDLGAPLGVSAAEKARLEMIRKRTERRKQKP